MRALWLPILLCLHGCSAGGGDTQTPSSDGWLGRWYGPEGTYLDVAGTSGAYEITVKDLDGARTFSGSAAENGFERQGDAERVMAVLGKRMARFGLALHPEKTRLLHFRRPSRSRGEGKSPTAFDFLGFCWYWRRTRKGSWAVTCKTRRARLARAIKAVHVWCQDHRHLPVKQQHEALRRRVQGHINYFGVNGNMPSLRRFLAQVKRSWVKWLNRRSQRSRLNWERYKDLLRDLPLPQPRIVVSIWS